MYVCGLIEHVKDNELMSYSAIVINNCYVITTAHILSNHIPFLSGLNNHNRPTDDKYTLVYYNEHDKKLFKTIKLIGTLGCGNIYESTDTFLYHWNIDNENEKPLKQLLAQFLIFSMNENEDCLDDLTEELRKLWFHSKNVELFKSQEIYVKSAPFGNRHLINSYSQGVISNVFGINNCFLLSDCPTVHGAEGSPVFIKTNGKPENEIFGIVLSSLNWWKGEWLGLTMITPFASLLGEIFNYKLMINPLRGHSTAFIVRIISGNNWGSGILINKTLGLFITNSHVIANDDSIRLIWNDLEIDGTLIFKTSDDALLDLAVVKCSDDANLAKVQRSHMSRAEVYQGAAKIGEEVYALGYPIIPSSATVTKGFISTFNDVVLNTTCTILPGASGGAIINKSGFLIGVITSNAKHNDTGAVFPRVNNVIPICVFWHILENYFDTLDKKILEELELKGNQPIWATLPSKL